MAREPKVEVELVEPGDGWDAARRPHAGPGPGGPSPSEASAGPGAGDRTGGAAPAQDRASTRRRTWRLTAAVAAVVAGLVATQAVLDARERAVYARFASVPGVLPPFGDGLEALWSAAAARDAAAWAWTGWNGLELDGTTLGAQVGADGVPLAAAFDARSGTVVWSTPLGEPEPLLAAGADGGWWIGCDSTTGAGALLACLVPTELTETPDDPDTTTDDDDRPTSAASSVAVLDPRTGELLRRLPDAPYAMVRILGDLVVTAHAGPDLSLTVRARDARSGADVWSHTTPPGTARAPQFGDPQESTPALVRVGDDVVLQGATSVVRLEADGTVAWTSPVDAGERDYADLREVRRGTLVLRVYPMGEAAGAAAALGADGGRVELPARDPVYLPVDDGSEPGLLLLSDGLTGGVTAWDARTREVRWQVEGVRAELGVVLGGRAYLSTTTGTLLALDLGDGTELWRAEPDADAPWRGGYSPGLATDGRVLLVLRQRDASGASEDPTATAYAIRDGRRLWSQTLPDGVDHLEPRASTLLGRGGQDMETVQAFG